MPETVLSLAKRLSMSEASLLVRLRDLGAQVSGPLDVVPDNVASAIVSDARVVDGSTFVDGKRISFTIKTDDFLVGSDSPADRLGGTRWSLRDDELRVASQI